MTRNWKENTNILVVEDDYLTLQLFRTRLEMEGLHVFSANNGLSALQLISEVPFDALITDLMMPAMNGFQLIQEIRNFPASIKNIPIIVISANHNENEMIACFGAGADDYMTKPISMPLLIERLWRLMERSTGDE